MSGNQFGISERQIAPDAGIPSGCISLNPHTWAAVGMRPQFTLTTGVDPTAAQLGHTLTEGDAYWHPIDKVLRVYTSAAWTTYAASGISGTGTYTLTTGTITWSDAGGINLGASGYLKGGTNPASAGMIRAPNNTYIALARNAANNADLNIIKANGSNLIEFGANLAATTVAGALASTTGGIAATVAGTTVGLTITNTGTGNDITGTGFTVAQSGAVGVTVSGANVGLTFTDSGTGNTLTATNWSVSKAGVITGKGIVNVGTFGNTGNATITGDLAVTGALSFGGNWTVAATLTANQLVLSSAGVAPAGTVNYLVCDNTGDSTTNVLTGKQFHIAINGTDEYDFSSTIADFNGNALDNCGFLILNAATAPAGTEVYAVNDNTGDLTLNALTGKTINLAINNVDIAVLSATEFDLTGAFDLKASTALAGTEVYIVHDNTGDLTVNAKTGKTFNVAIAGTDEYVFGATTLDLANGNSIKFLGNNGILDSNGNELVEFVATGSATNGLKITNSATGNPVMIGADGTGATADRGIRFNDSNGNEELVLVSTAAAVNEIGIVNVATGAKPIIRAQGEGDLGMIFANFDGVNTEEILILAATATAVNEVTITSSATGNGPIIGATGETDVTLRLTGKGTGGISHEDNIVYGSIASGGNLTLSSTKHATKGDVRIPNAEIGLRIGGTAARGTVGTNAIHLYTGTAPVGALANCGSIYMSATDLTVMDAAGNATIISPHDEAGNYIINSFSNTKNKTVKINLEELVAELIADNPKYAKHVQILEGNKVHNK